MGPLVPDVVTDELNLLIALLIGIAFGFVLEQAGFSSSRKLTGLFYGTDFTVLRVFFTAGVTAMSGVLILTQFGWLDADLIYINPMFLQSAIAGGLIMGVGFVLGGYCPGTSFCGLAVGRVDAMAFAAGGFAGIFAFGEAFAIPSLQNFYKAGSKGDLLAPAALGMQTGQFAAVMIAIAVAAFVMTTRIERNVNPESGTWRFPAMKHRIAGTALIVLAIVLFVVPDRKARLMAKAADPGYLTAHPVRMMAADELAIHLLDQDPKFQLIDVREPAEYGKGTLPDALNVPLSALLGKESRSVLAAPGKTRVFLANDEASAVTGAALARIAGYENVAALEGGLSGFMRTIVSMDGGANPAVDRETLEFRTRAGHQIAAMIRQRSAPKPVKAVRRVQGGCGG